MRNKFTIAALLLVSATANAAPSADLLKLCSVKDAKTGESYIPERNFTALSHLLTDAVLAKYAKSCESSLTKDERAKYEQAKKTDAREQRDDLETIKKTHQGEITTPGLPTTIASANLGVAEKPAFPDLIVRGTNTVTSLGALLSAQKRADGASFSYTRDFEADNVLTALSGAVFVKHDFVPDMKDKNQATPFTAIILAPGVEFDQERNRASPKKDVDSIAFHMLSEFDWLPSLSSDFIHQFRFAGNLNTDSLGQQKIWSGFAEWQPYSIAYALSTPLPVYQDSPLYYSFAPVVHVEYDDVTNAGALTNVVTGDRYFRAGPIATVNFFVVPGYGALSRLTFSAQYDELWGTANAGGMKDTHFWQTHVGYNLDDTGNASISATYRQGELPTTIQEVRDFKTQLTVKY